ncbi:hypothetical protein ACHAXT_013295 [Thalassiosira profunda]
MNMTLAVNVAAEPSDERRDENASPLKRKSDKISPSTLRLLHRGPLSDVNSNSDGSGSNAASKASTPSKPPTPARAPLPPSAASRFHSGSKYQPHSKLSKEEVQATDEGRASVGALSSWLAHESAKKKKPIHRPTAGASPISFRAKPRIQRSEVEATNGGRASVKKLSTWMANDPFEQKKVRTIRTGAKVIARSRAFEKDKESIAQKDIKEGSVGERQAWLSGAFKHEEEEEVKRPVCEKKVRPYQMKKEEVSPEPELKSVSDKKAWLSNAFKKEGEGGGAPGIQPTKSFEAKQHVSLNQAISFDMNSQIDVYPSIGKSASAECSGIQRHSAIQQTKSCDGMGASGEKGRAAPTLDKQRSVVRLYRSDSNEEKEASPEVGAKSVHDRQAWLSSAFKRPGEGAVEEKKVTAVKAPVKSAKDTKAEEEGAEEADVYAACLKEGEKAVTEEKEENMSVADRAKWLKRAFK